VPGIDVKIRLYRGPHDGKVIGGQSGAYHIMWTDKKKMSRKQRHEWLATRWQPVADGFSMAPMHPMVTAEYQRTKYQHPDGSIFYEWTGYSRPYGP